MAEFTKKTTSNGVVQYRNKTENKLVSLEDMDTKYAAVKEELDLADEGTVIDSDTVIKGEGDGVLDADGNPITDKKEDEVEEDDSAAAADDEPVATNPYNRTVPQSEEGMGFKRVGGKTVDVFDSKTPHTHVRVIEGLMVPLSEDNYNTKTDAEIYDRLKDLKLV